jgi:uncharacterized membrane protein
MRFANSFVLLLIILVASYLALSSDIMGDEWYRAPLLILLFFFIALFIVRRTIHALSKAISSRYDSSDAIASNRKKAEEESTCEGIVWKSSE